MTSSESMSRHSGGEPDVRLFWCHCQIRHQPDATGTGHVASNFMSQPTHRTSPVVTVVAPCGSAISVRSVVENGMSPSRSSNRAACGWLPPSEVTVAEYSDVPL